MQYAPPWMLSQAPQTQPSLRKCVRVYRVESYRLHLCGLLKRGLKFHQPFFFLSWILSWLDWWSGDLSWLGLEKGFETIHWPDWGSLVNSLQKAVKSKKHGNNVQEILLWYKCRFFDVMSIKGVSLLFCYLRNWNTSWLSEENGDKVSGAPAPLQHIYSSCKRQGRNILSLILSPQAEHSEWITPEWSIWSHGSLSRQTLSVAETKSKMETEKPLNEHCLWHWWMI